MTGSAHALVHLPLVLLTVTYNGAGSRWVVAPLMVVTIAAAGVCYGWLRDASRSIWPVALAHAAGNTAMATITVGAIPGAPIAFAYVAGEGGLVIATVFTSRQCWLSSLLAGMSGAPKVDNWYVAGMRRSGRGAGTSGAYCHPKKARANEHARIGR